MKSKLNKATIQGFKSIRDLTDFEFTNLNIIVGANGAGKSNLLSFFRMLRAFVAGDMQRFVTDQGGAGDLLFNGRKSTSQMYFQMNFDNGGYRFFLVPTAQDFFAVEEECCFAEPETSGWWKLGNNPSGISLMTQEVKEKKKGYHYSHPVYEAISSWQIYHFHDTGKTAGMRHYEIVEDNYELRSDASNIGPFLLRLQKEYPDEYREIVNAVRLVMPFFDDFLLIPQNRGPKIEVNISWRQKGSDYPMQPWHLSDGSIRFICLATALLQPIPPSAIIIDEPELGLHPSAISILAELVKLSSLRTQIIVATQNPLLIDQFAVENVIVTSHKNGESHFERLKEADFSLWLEDYSVGELWTKNVIAGGPCYE